MNAEPWSAGRLRQETVSSPRLPIGDQSPTTWTAGAETAQEEEGRGGNIMFIFPQELVGFFVQQQSITRLNLAQALK